MRTLRTLLCSIAVAIVLMICAPTLSAQTNYTTNVTLNNLLGTGGAVASAKVCASAVDVYGNPLTFSAPNWGLVEPNALFCGTATSGAIAGGFNLPDACHTNQPTPIFYNVTIQPMSGGVATGSAISLNRTPIPNVCGASYPLDSYTPSTSVISPPSQIVATGSSVPSSCTSPSILLATVSTVTTGYVCSNGVYAAFAQSGGATIAGDIGGTSGTPKVVGIQGQPVSSASPAVGQSLAWNGSQYAPASPAAPGAIPGVQSTPLIQQITRSSISVDSMKVTGTSRDYCYSLDASSTIWLDANPAVSDTLTISGTTITFVASGATGNQVNIGLTAVATTVALNTMLASSSDSNLVTNTYTYVAPNLIVIKPNSGSANPQVAWNTASNQTIRSYYANYDDCWTQRASRYLGLPLAKLSVYAQSGNQQCNEIVNQLFQHDAGPGSVDGQLYVGGGPVNDVTYGGGSPAGTPGPTSTSWPYSTGPFQSCLTAKLLWYGIPSTSKVMATTTGSTTGTCAADNTRWATGGSAAVVGETCTASGSSFSLPITVGTTGPIFGFYLSIDGDTGTWTYTLDSGTPVSVSTASSVNILTNNAQTTGMFSFTIPSVSAGSHTITFHQTASGTMAILAIAQLPPAGDIYSKPWVVQFDVAPQPSSVNAASVTQYNSVLDSVVAQMQGYGLNVNLAPESLTVQPSAQDGAMVGSTDHENTRVGEREIFDAFQSALSGLQTQPGQTAIYAPACVNVNGGATYTVGDGTACITANGPATVILPMWNASTNTSLGGIRTTMRELRVYNDCPFSSCIVTLNPAYNTGNGTAPGSLFPGSFVDLVNFGGPNWFRTGTNILSGQTGSTSGAALASGASASATASIAGPIPSAVTPHGPQVCYATPANGGVVPYPFVVSCAITAQNVATVYVTNFSAASATPGSYIFYVRALSDY